MDEAPAKASESATPIAEAASPDLENPQLALERTRDSQANRETRPPDAETVTFRSVTMVEIYSEREIDSLTKALDAIEFVNLDARLSSSIARAREGYGIRARTFSLVTKRPDRALYATGVTDLPAGIDHIFCSFEVFGPSVMAMVFTFVLANREARQIDAALWRDAESHLYRHEGIERVRNVHDSKADRIQELEQEVVYTPPQSGSTARSHRC
jgi:hypothetical protein